MKAIKSEPLVAPTPNKSVLSKVFRFKKKESSKESKAVVLMDMVRQASSQRLAAHKIEEKISVESDTVLEHRNRGRSRATNEEKRHVRIADEEADMILSPEMSAAPPQKNRSNSRGSTLERKLMPRGSKTRKLNNDRLLRSDLVDYAVEKKHTEEIAEGENISAAANPVSLIPSDQEQDESFSLNLSSLSMAMISERPQNRRQVMSMKLGSKIVSSTPNFSSKNKSRQVSVSIRPAITLSSVPPSPVVNNLESDVESISSAQKSETHAIPRSSVLILKRIPEGLQFKVFYRSDFVD